MITDRETGWVEPTIAINGVELTFPQAMSVRVAISSYLMFVTESSVRNDIGWRLADGYREHLEAVERIMRTR